MGRKRAYGQRAQHHVTPEDRAWIAERLVARKMSPAALARAAGMSRQNMYQILAGEVAHTGDWTAIVSTLGGVPPSGSPPITDERLRNIVRRWPELSETDRVFVIELIARLADPKKA